VKKALRYHLSWIAGFLLLGPALFGSISVSPSIFELKIQPGKTFTDSIRVVNVTESATDIVVYLSDFGLSPEGQIRFYDAGTTPYSLKDYVRINPTSFSLEPGEEKWVRFSVRIPAGQVGESQGILFFQTVPRKVKSPVGRQVLVAARIGSTVYAAVKPTIDASVDIVNVLFRQTSDDHSLEYAAIVRNTGNVHVRPKGKLTLKDPSGHSVSIPNINDKNGSVLRDGVRLYEGTLQGNFPEGLYLTTLELDFGQEAREVEKAIRLAGASRILDFQVSYQPPNEEKKSPMVTFSFRPGGLEKALGHPRSVFRLRTLVSEIVISTPLKVCLDKSGVCTAAIEKKLDPGIYIADVLLFDTEDPEAEDARPITTFQKLEVTE